MPSAIELAQGDPQLIAAVQRSRRLLGRKALIAAAASAVPIPGIDWAADAALLSRLVPQISAEFGLAVTQIENLPPHQRDRVQQAASAAGALLVGKLITRDLLVKLAAHAGVRMTARQAAKYAPIAGQLVSAALGYAALRALGELHIRDCVKVARSVHFLLPPPAATSPPSVQAPARSSRLQRAWTRLRQ